jgi:hypothetical protein
MLSRILAIICLVTAFAQPFIPLDDSTNTENITSIYIDNSYSMQAEGTDGNLLNEAKNQAIDLVRTFDENEKVNLITSDMLSLHQRFYSKSEVIDMIKNIDFSARTTPLQNILNLQLDLLNSSEKEANQRIFMFSDLQKSSTNLEGWSRPEVPSYIYQCIAENPGNIFIDSVWFKTPVHRTNTPIDIHFRVRNLTEKDQNEIPVTLNIEGNTPGPKRISIPANSFVDEQITFTDKQAGKRSGKISISSSQLFFDDEFYFSYTIKEQVNILLITGKNDRNLNIEQLYGLDDYYNCSTKSIDRVSMEDFTDKELIIYQNVNTIPSGIQDMNEKSLKNGATVALIPGKKIDSDNWNSYLSELNLPLLSKMDSINSKVSYFNSSDPLYTGVFEGEPDNFQFPYISAGYGINVTSNNNFISLFGINENRPFLSYSPFNNGRLILMSTPLDQAYTNFQNHALFAATFLRFAETASFQSPLFMEIGEMGNFPLNKGIDETNPIHLMNKEYQVDIIPQLLNSNASRSISFNHLEDQIKQAGIYDLSNENDFSDKIAINYDRSESITECFEMEQMKANFQAIGWEKTQEMTLNESGTIEINKFKTKEYWRILLILTLVFIAIEILLLKLWRT